MKESSEVLARKYRPSNFDELIGQETISQTLSLALDANRLSHAYLFSGLRGSGKTSTARIFAKALICEEGISHKPCGVCSNCETALQNRHIDIIEMDAASNRGIDDIKSLVEQTKYKPNSARFKVIIIDEVHMLSTPAFNALLKTLEEPPSYVKFILATTDPLKLPATILSRTQHFRFKSIKTSKVVNHLAHILNLEEIGFENDALEILARSGNGSLRDTLTLLDQAIIYSKNFVNVLTVTDMLGLVDPKFISDIFNAVFAKDYGQVVTYVKVLDDYEAEMVVDELIAYLKDKLYNQDALFSTLVIDRYFRILSDAKSLFFINADGSFVLSMIFFKMIEALRIKEIDEMIESMQNEIERPIIQDKQIIQDKPIIQEQPQIIQDKPIIQEVEDEGAKLFKTLVVNIKDRNIDLGECFDRDITYISYEENVLTWESCVDDECKKALKHGWGAINQLIKELYGFHTKVKASPCTKEVVEKKNDAPIIQEPIVSQPIVEEKKGILDEPMVQKAIEIFEATKITVQTKNP